MSEFNKEMYERLRRLAFDRDVAGLNEHYAPAVEWAAGEIAWLRSLLADGVRRIGLERQRQIHEEGWTPDHDDGHDGEQLAMAAALYAAPVQLFEKMETTKRVAFADPWRWWLPGWDDKRDVIVGTADRIRQLEKAGALIAAEIERLERASSACRTGGDDDE